MMLIICDKDACLAGKFLIENTNRNFVFKQLLELCQLICSAGISDVYKKIPQGKELQEWILQNLEWTADFASVIFDWCYYNVEMKPETYDKINEILRALYEKADICFGVTICTDAIFRYKQGYESKYPTNTLLPIDEAVKQYKKYILEYKFKKEK